MSEIANKIYWSKCILKQRCRCEWNYNLFRWEKWFYTIKAIVCIFFFPGTLNYIEEETITAGITKSGCYFNGEYTEHWFECIIVGYGLFSNWKWDLLHDSD